MTNFADKRNQESSSIEHKGSLPSKCPKCKKGDLEYGSFEVEGMYYKVNCLNDDCGARFWESQKSDEAWGERE